MGADERQQSCHFICLCNIEFYRLCSIKHIKFNIAVFPKVILQIFNLHVMGLMYAMATLSSALADLSSCCSGELFTINKSILVVSYPVVLLTAQVIGSAFGSPCGDSQFCYVEGNCPLKPLSDLEDYLICLLIQRCLWKMKILYSEQRVESSSFMVSGPQRLHSCSNKAQLI